MTMNPDEMARWAKVLEADQEGQTPAALPPEIHIKGKQTAKGEWYYDFTYQATRLYSDEERSSSIVQALQDCDVIKAELIARSTVPQPEATDA